MDYGTFILAFLLGMWLNGQSNVSRDAINIDPVPHQSLNSGGNHVSGEKGSISYSIGQVIPVGGDPKNLSVHNGVQYPKTNTLYGLFSEMDIIAYPNPITEYFFLKMGTIEPSNLGNYFFFDIQGKVLSQGILEKTISKIVPPPLKSGIYLLHVSQGSGFGKTLKIIKD